MEKIAIFAKGLTRGSGLKLAIFPSFVFRQYRAGKCVKQYSRTKKRLSRLSEQQVQKVEKLRFGFGPKLPIFPCFFFRQYRAGKCVLRYSRTKKRLSRL